VALVQPSTGENGEKSPWVAAEADGAAAVAPPSGSISRRSSRGEEIGYGARRAAETKGMGGGGQTVDPGCQCINTV
jgi:hypothetical protein